MRSLRYQPSYQRSLEANGKYKIKFSEEYANGFSYDHFREIANITDLDSPYQNAGAMFSETSTRSTARRLRRTRQHLGTYRYDLTVAIRVVNKIETEMMKAEWENWLLDETTRCKQVQTMLQANQAGSSTSKKGKTTKAQQVMEAKARERHGNMEELRRWHGEYCSSCKLEQDMLQKGRKHLTFG